MDSSYLFCIDSLQLSMESAKGCTYIKQKFYNWFPSSDYSSLYGCIKEILTVL